jgi:DHA1 family multidrug resistance protein-like MFS transporter
MQRLHVGENANLAILLFATMCFRATSNMLQTTVPLYLRYELQSSEFVVSLVVAIAGIFSIMSLLYTTLTSVNVFKVLLASLWMIAIALPVFLIDTNLISFGITTLFLYFWTGSVPPLLLTAVMFISSVRTQQRNIILLTAGLSLSLVTGPIVQAAVLQIFQSNLSYSIAFFSIPLILSAAMLSLTHVDTRTAAKRAFSFSLMKNRTYLRGIVTNEIYSVPFVALLTFGGILARNDFNVDYGGVEFLFAIFFSASLVARLQLLRFSSQKHMFVYAIIALTAAGIVLLYFSTIIVELGIAFVFLGYSHGLSYPVSASYIAESLPKEKLASGNSLAALISQLVSFGSLPLLGVIVGVQGLKFMFATLLLPVALLSIGYLAVLRTRKESELLHH